MALTLNSIAKDTAANSYISLADANYHFSTKYKSSEKWDSLSNDQKSQLLIEATRNIDLFVFGGTKTTSTQALSWPRANLISHDGYQINSQTVPKQVQAAQCELADWILSEEDRMLSDIDIKQLDQFKAGPLDLKIKPNAATFPEICKQLLMSIGPGVLVAIDRNTIPVSISR